VYVSVVVVLRSAKLVVVGGKDGASGPFRHHQLTNIVSVTKKASTILFAILPPSIVFLCCHDPCTQFLLLFCPVIWKENMT
jgi:hypothetical protein